MENTGEAYEVPTLVEIGGYAELTRGSSAGAYIDGGTVPWIYSHFRPGGGSWE
ncbi:lasso RiPP family leader peptide-containing protein [Streptomyces sp. SID3343]|uniref:lasso RiPP family leader peptide-containing protein n=1 Tax=Streptomyces sp. SID3343 TaxID=2690260 RepID=UPI00136A69C6|nr:lasso RiPP family leader peptide-containing protein [Streptomyces sp. SID3343]MYV98278.1 lasso RiPP family leader peptide-containing protein [Streptomyces sp. SID3343]